MLEEFSDQLHPGGRAAGTHWPGAWMKTGELRTEKIPAKNYTTITVM
jgi:hypothetical protein